MTIGKTIVLAIGIHCSTALILPNQARAQTWRRDLLPALPGGALAQAVATTGGPDHRQAVWALDFSGNVYRSAIRIDLTNPSPPAWSLVPGPPGNSPGTSIAVDTANQLYMTDVSGNVWRNNVFNGDPSPWTNVSYGGCATWVGGGVWSQAPFLNGFEWVTGCGQPGIGGYGIFELDSNNVWQWEHGEAVQISASQYDGTPWVVNAQNHVYAWNGSGWDDETDGLPSNCAYQVAASSSNVAFVVSCEFNPTFDDYYVYERTLPLNWVRIDNSHDEYIAISHLAGVAEPVAPYSVDGSGNIYKWVCSGC